VGGVGPDATSASSIEGRSAERSPSPWLPARLSRLLQAVVDHGPRPGLAVAVRGVLDEFPTADLEGLRLPGGEWDHPDDSVAIAALEPALETVIAAPSGHGWPSLQLAGRPRRWTHAFVFGSGTPRGVLVVSADVAPDVVGEALLRVLLAALESACGNRDAAVHTGGTVAPKIPPPREVAREIAAALVEERGVQGIVDALREVMAVPCGVWDERGQPVAASGLSIDDLPILDAPRRSRRGVDVAITDDGRGWVIALVMHHDRLVASVGALLDVPAEQAAVSDLLIFGTIAAAAEFLRGRSVANAELRAWGELAAEVLFESDRDIVRRHAASVGYDLAAPHRVLVVACPKQAERMLPAIRSASRYLEVGAPVLVDEDRVAVLCRHDGPWNEISKAADSATSSPCAAGLSSQGPGIDAPTLFAEADLACAVGRAVGGPVVTRFEDLGLLRLLAAAGKPEQIREYVERNLGPLLEYDAAHGSSLVQTLCTYLDSGAALRVAAGRLMIHESTLKYRLHRIQALTNHDLTNPETRFDLHLACKAWDAARILRDLSTDDRT
jgi:hypothetical protein